MVYEALTSSQTIADDLEQVAKPLNGMLRTGLVDGLVDGVAQDTPLDVLAKWFEVALSPEAYETYLPLQVVSQNLENFGINPAEVTERFEEWVLG